MTGPKVWWKLLIQCGTHEQCTAIEELLESNSNCAAVSIQCADDEEVFEPPPGMELLWENNKLEALFHEQEEAIACQNQITSRFPSAPIEMESLVDKDWSREWMDNFKPMCFGQRLWIYPSWQSPPQDAKVPLLLDPGLAFGTGTHPTTRLCLKWLDSHDVKEYTVIDYGCGSGILAIASLLLGANQAMGIDIDPQALEASLENSQRNRIPRDKFFVHLPQDAPQMQAELLFANILAKPLLSLSTTFFQRLKPQGHLILSGILHEQATEICQQYEKQFEIVTTQEEEGWLMIHCKKP